MNERCSAWIDEGGAIANDHTVSPTGDLAFVGGAYGPTGFAVTAYDPRSGIQAWDSSYDGPRIDVLLSLAVSPDGLRVYATGVRDADWNEQSGDLVTIAYDARTGEQLWISSYDGPLSYPSRGGDAVDWGTAIEVAPDGSQVFVTGLTSGVATQSLLVDYVTIAFDAVSGERLWLVRHDDSKGGWNEPAALTVDPAGRYVCATGFGSGQGGVIDTDFLTVCYATDDGEQLWSSTFGSRLFADKPIDIATTPDGKTVLLTGAAIDPQSPPSWLPRRDFHTIAYGAESGNLIWSAEPHDGYPRSLEISPDGTRAYVTGAAPGTDVVESLNNEQQQNIMTFAYDVSSGRTLWANRFRNPLGRRENVRYDEGVSIGVDPGGERIYVTGVTDDLAFTWAVRNWHSDVTLAYDVTTGDQAWVARHGSKGVPFLGGRAAHTDMSADGTLLLVITWNERFAYDLASDQTETVRRSA